MSCLYDGFLAPDHLADLRKSGLDDATIQAQAIRSVPPHMLDALLGFTVPAAVQSAYLIPFAAPGGGWLDFVRIKVFPSITTDQGTIKYLQRKRSGVRLFFPVLTLQTVRHSNAPLYVCEGEKKALLLAQTGLPTIGITGIEGWHQAGSRDLHPDLDDVGLQHRTVYLVPDGDWRTNGDVARAVRRCGEALRRRGAEGRLVLIPDGFKGVDDYLVATA